MAGRSPGPCVNGTRQRPRQRRTDRTMTDRTLPNPERGCGHLKRGKGYIRGVTTSKDGVLPSFVKCDPPIPFREHGTDGEFTRGFLQLDGHTMQVAVENDVTTFQRCYPGDLTDVDATQNMVGKVYPNETAIPTQESKRHADRIRQMDPMGDHWGAIPYSRQTDLLMRAGKSHYPDPDDFIQEAIDHGISKAIPLSKRQEPPEIVPGVTRMWIVHPDVDDDGNWGVIGYAYLDEVVFTEPADGRVPDYIQQYHDQGRLDIVDIEDPPEVQEAKAQNSLDDFDTDDDDAGADDSDADPQGPDGEDTDADDQDPSAVVQDTSDSDQDVREADPERDVKVIRRAEGMDHITYLQNSGLLCGRDTPATGADHIREADPEAIAQDFDICGTCLSALKSQVEGDADG